MDGSKCRLSTALGSSGQIVQTVIAIDLFTRYSNGYKGVKILKLSDILVATKALERFSFEDQTIVRPT